MTLHQTWYDEWLARKHDYARTSDPFLNSDTFHALVAGTGLPPIHQTSMFPFKSVSDGASRFLGMSKSGEKPFARIYTRLGNPTTEHLEMVLFQIECHHIIERALEADEKSPTVGSLVCSSGMAAISCTLLALANSGDEIASGNVYGCTDSLLRTMRDKFGIGVHWVDTTRSDSVAACLERNPRIVALFVETPDNPTLSLSDIQALAQLAEHHRIPLVVDNTFASSYLQQPLRLGADIVVHSLTKYANGHSASVAGCILGPFRFMQEKVFPLYKDLGPTPGPFDSWLNSLCIQDLGHRVEASCKTAAVLAEFLLAHPRVVRVHYPGLSTHPHALLARRQMRLPGAMIAFELDGGMTPSKRLMNYFARPDTPMELAVSLGGAVSYIEHPASMTHAGVPREDRLRRGITDELVRLSVGLEGASVLMGGLERGITTAYDNRGRRPSAAAEARMTAVS